MRRRKSRHREHTSLQLIKAVIPAILFTAFIVWLVLPQTPSHPSIVTDTGRKPVLNPELFRGLVKDGYLTAKQYPQLLEQLRCYCGCDNPKHTPYHRNLYECFTDTHGANCQVCVEEALIARNLYEQGMDPAQIRSSIDKRYGF
ncbi:MAG: CYCXC family (seleno)protein [Candidatus Caldarchaeum sp.]